MLGASRISRFRTGCGLTALICLLALAGQANADWEPLGPRGTYIEAVFPLGKALFMTTDAGLWRSGSPAADWACVLPGAHSARLLEAGSRIFAYRVPSPPGTFGIFSSADDGRTWQPLIQGIAVGDSTALASASSLLFFGRYLIAGTENGLYRSPDSGRTWARVDSTSPRFLYFGGWSLQRHGSDLLADSPAGMLVSRDSGKSWKPLSPNLVNGQIISMASLGRYVIAAGAKIYRLAEGASAWDTVSNQALSGLTAVGGDLYGISADLNVSPTNAILRSSDSGKTWRQVNADYHFDKLAASENELWAVDLNLKTDRVTLLRSGDRGQTLDSVPGPLAAMIFSVAGSGATLLASSQIVQIARIAGTGALIWSDADFPGGPDANLYSPWHAAMDGDLAAVTLENGDILYSRDGGAGWNQIRVVDGDSQVHRAESIAIKDGILFSGDGGCLYRSDDFGKTWICVRSPASADTGPYDVRFLRFRGPYYFTFYFRSVYRSSDKGIHWAEKSAGLAGNLNALAAAGNDLYAAGDSGVFHSADDGETWSRVDSAHTGFKDLAAAGAALLAVAYDGLYGSADGGRTWTPANQGFWAAGKVVSMTQLGEDIYVGTSVAGVWRRPLAEIVAAIRTGPKDRELPMGNRNPSLVRGPTGPILRFTLSARGRAIIEAFDVRGGKSLLADAFLDPGEHRLHLAIRSGAPRMVLLRLRAGGSEWELKALLP